MYPLLWSLCLLFATLSSAWAQPIVRLNTRCEDGTFAITAPVAKVFAGAGNGQIVPLTAASRIQVFRWQLQSTADVGLKFIYGTAVDCGTGETDLVGKMNIFSTVDRTVDSQLLTPPLTVPVSQALCLDSTGAATITGAVTYCLVQ